ncbi:MAG: hypothetical protein BWY75_01233 [bacterium ADurb.Bin425]|nr:MAG: hypothetical protein BWY75_01233 [bacterium ADurb.Bin425]
MLNYMQILKALFCYLASILLLAPSPAKAQTETLFLRQKGNIVGTINVYMNKTALRVEFGKPSCYLIATAPKWDITLYNELNKNGMCMSLDEWLKHTPHWLFSLEDEEWLRKMPVLPSKTERLLGENCVVYRLAHKEKDGKIKAKLGGIHGRIFMAENNLAPEEACSILRRIHSIPEAIGKGIPLQILHEAESQPDGKKLEAMTFKYPRTATSQALLTEKLSFLKVAPNKSFQVPSQFNKVKQEDQVLRDQTHQDRSQLLLELMN